MTDTKNTKRALLGSIIALLLCFVMLLGTTFAWFTGLVPASDTSGLAEALSAGGIISINQDLVLQDVFSPSQTEPTVLNLDASSVVTYSAAGQTAAICDLAGNADLTVNGSGSFTYDKNYLNSDVSLGFIFRATGHSKLVINGGTFQAGLTCVQAGGDAQVEIYGGFFSADYGYDNTYWVLNLIDGSNAAITVYGGTFVNFDPAHSKTEDPEANFVADGYQVVSATQDNGDIWYTVVPNE